MICVTHTCVYIKFYEIIGGLTPCRLLKYRRASLARDNELRG